MIDEAQRVGIKLKRIRERTGLSQKDVATALRMPSASSYQYYEDKFKDEFLPLQLVRDLVSIFSPYGVTARELYALAGISTVDGDVQVSRSAGEAMAKVEELDVRVAAGGGQTAEEEKVVAEWMMPKALLKFATNAVPENIKILTVVGDSMPVSFRPFDKVMVDISDRIPSPPGIFALWDGLGLVVKRVEHIAHSEPPTVRITSENPNYAPYERTLEEAHLHGRVLGKWTWT